MSKRIPELGVYAQRNEQIAKKIGDQGGQPSTYGGGDGLGWSPNINEG